MKNEQFLCFSVCVSILPCFLFIHSLPPSFSSYAVLLFMYFCVCLYILFFATCISTCDKCLQCLNKKKIKKNRLSNLEIHLRFVMSKVYFKCNPKVRKKYKGLISKYLMVGNGKTK